MKNYNIIFLATAFILLMVSSGCTKDKGETLPILEEIPELQFNTEAVVVKIGSENKYTLEVTQGGGEYSVFCLNEEIAKVELAENEILIEGISNGKTLIIISDKNGFYRRLPVTVYTVETLELKDYNFELTTLLGRPQTVITKVILGNGEYKVTTNNPKVRAYVEEGDTITITGTSMPDTFTATVTVTDASNFSASITLTVKSTTIPYSTEELEEIMSNNTKRYIMNEEVFDASYFTYLNTQEDGQQLYGWDFYGIYYYKLWFTGDKSTGRKENGKLSFHFSSVLNQSYTNEPVDYVEIIKNDGTYLWGVFSFVKDEKLHYGYFCDRI